MPKRKADVSEEKEKTAKKSKKDDAGDGERKGALESAPERNLKIDVPLLLDGSLTMRIPGAAIGVGKPGSGKTHMFKYLLYQIAPYVEHGMVVCTNPEAELEWDCLPTKFVIKHYSEEVIEEFMNMQEKNNFPLSFIFIDDPIGSANFMGKSIKKLVTQLRKYKVFLAWMIQYVNAVVPPVVRNCIFNWFIFQTLEQRGVEALFNSCLSPYFQKTLDLQRAMAEMLPEHHCFFVDTLKNKLRIVSAPPPEKLPPFLITWETKPQKDEETVAQERSGNRGAGDVGTINATLARVEAANKKRVRWEEDNIVPVQNLDIAHPPARPSKETIDVAHGRVTRDSPFAQGDKVDRREAGDDSNPLHVQVPEAPAAPDIRAVSTAVSNISGKKSILSVSDGTKRQKRQ